jgi:hypothetical protein
MATDVGRNDDRRKMELQWTLDKTKRNGMDEQTMTTMDDDCGGDGWQWQWMAIAPMTAL